MFLPFLGTVGDAGPGLYSENHWSGHSAVWPGGESPGVAGAMSVSHAGSL